MNQRLNKPLRVLKAKTTKRKKPVAVTFCSSHLNAHQSQWTALRRFCALITMAMALCLPGCPRGRWEQVAIQTPTRTWEGLRLRGALEQERSSGRTGPLPYRQPALPEVQRSAFSTFSISPPENNSGTNTGNYGPRAQRLCVSFITFERAENRTNGETLNICLGVNHL